MSFSFFPSVTIGIPAYNEAQNIGALLQAIFCQHQTNFFLKEVIVVSDGSSDTTALAVRQTLQQLRPSEAKKVRLIAHQARAGKLKRLTEIYAQATSDLIVIFDADTMPANPHVIEQLVVPFSNSRVVMVSAHNVPTPAHSIFQFFLNSWHRVWYEVRRTWKEGHNVHTARGCGIALRSEFAKAMQFPRNILSDSKWLYFSALQQGQRFFFQPTAKIWYHTPLTAYDYVLQKQRGFGERHIFAHYFGEEIAIEFIIPWRAKFIGVSQSLLTAPLALVAAACFFTYITLVKKCLPHPKSSTLFLLHPQHWAMATSTKHEFTLNHTAPHY